MSNISRVQSYHDAIWFLSARRTAFGSRLITSISVRATEDKSTDPSSINYSFENIAALLAQRLGGIRLLLESRDEFVSSARRLAQKHDNNNYSVFLSYSREDEKVAAALTRSLEAHGLTTFLDRSVIEPGASFEGSLNEAIDRSQHMIVLIGENRHESRWQENEIRTFLRQAATDKEPRFLIPFAIGDKAPKEIPHLLQQYKVVALRGDYEAAAAQIAALIGSKPISESKGATLRVQVTATGSEPVEQVQLTALAQNGTTIDVLSNKDGRANLDLVAGRAYTLLVAHLKFRAKIIERFEVDRELDVRLISRPGVGSIIIHSTGSIPGLSGRLNPILDTLNRTYLYADNIAIAGGKPQPTKFVVNEPIELEDAQGSRFEVIVKIIAGRTSLIEYRKLG